MLDVSLFVMFFNQFDQSTALGVDALLSTLWTLYIPCVITFL